MKRKTLLIIFFFLVMLIFLFFIINKDAVLESTTQNIDVISKEHDTTTSEQWIVLSNREKVYVEDFSIWALIQEHQNYTIVYDLMKKTGRFKLRTIVPGDYNGQF